LRRARDLSETDIRLAYLAGDGETGGIGGLRSLARALAASGAVAVRLEESRVGYPISRWLELVSGNDPWSLYRAAVVVHAGEDGATTRGMHVFSLPDAHVAYDWDTNETVASALLGVLNVFALTDDPLLRTGHTFSADPGSPRRVLERWPDGLHAPGHPCHNPFGVWRIGPAGVAPGGPAPELDLVFSPPLVTVLATREKRAGRALTRDEAEDLADRAACAAMDPHEARALERRRGHADLEPDRVWEQWQVLRRR
jgi:hypothetical protein